MQAQEWISTILWYETITHPSTFESGFLEFDGSLKIFTLDSSLLTPLIKSPFPGIQYAFAKHVSYRKPLRLSSINHINELKTVHIGREYLRARLITFSWEICAAY